MLGFDMKVEIYNLKIKFIWLYVCVVSIQQTQPKIPKAVTVISYHIKNEDIRKDHNVPLIRSEIK